MEFYLILNYILLQFPTGKWVLLGRTSEGGSRNSDFYTIVRWPLILFLLINTRSPNYCSYNSYSHSYLLPTRTFYSRRPPSSPSFFFYIAIQIYQHIRKYNGRSTYHCIQRQKNVIDTWKTDINTYILSRLVSSSNIYLPPTVKFP